MPQPIYQVDAFTDKVFAGNPAAICPLPAWLPAETMQAIAAENNLAETAFFVAREGAAGEYDLRWFTPAVEVELCGHATLASAHVLFNHLGATVDTLTFHSRSGPLHVSRQPDGRLTLDFPARPPQPLTQHPDGLIDGLRQVPLQILAGPDLVALYGSEAEIRAIHPDMTHLAKVEYRAVIVTAPGSGDVDFVSRFFGPRVGVPEDPVTGSAHTTLVPYWAEKLGKTTLRARQVSARGGDLWCELRGDRVLMSGYAVTYLKGEIDI
ncbi:PhzF family phenazine biosynthesis protein [Hymenobacter sp. BT175]|uniref:PhzF family phenazine biosynthesis protein n=1 Tax=Hymenobacter translucens TaxID=2886507 RepID=UPI001D0ED90B|nr:PhzF family phenazine biosynthesis protein [Hymenobacter translucens]MCC2545384.1 PhzF family phenazine biosynthesis protein [Hymenobacter translucens]